MQRPHELFAFTMCCEGVWPRDEGPEEDCAVVRGGVNDLLVSRDGCEENDCKGVVGAVGVCGGRDGV